MTRSDYTRNGDGRHATNGLQKEHAPVNRLAGKGRRSDPLADYFREVTTEPLRRTPGSKAEPDPWTELLAALLETDRPGFPLHVFPPLLRRYVEAGARSIHCPTDLLAVPLLAVAGAAIGRSGRRLKVKDGWTTSSCLWAVAMTDSSGGKTPALNAVENWYDDRQEAEYLMWKAAKDAHANDPEHEPPPGPFPALKLTDTTIESLRGDLEAGPVLFSRDELGAWCHQMGQYKSGGGGERFDWCSFWSHSPWNVGRKTERVFVKEPFVSVAGMLVPASARELNYRGNSDDGFVHRMLIAYPLAMDPRMTRFGVPDELTAEYKRRMSRLFAPSPGGKRVALTFDEDALEMVEEWANGVLYPQLDGAPGWKVSKYRKLVENCLRLCLVLHELWRVADDSRPLSLAEAVRRARLDEAAGADPDDGPECSPEELLESSADFWTTARGYYDEDVPFREMVVDRMTVARAIEVVEYFRCHIDVVQCVLGEEIDEVDRHYQRLKHLKPLSARTAMQRTTYRTKDQVLGLFAEWARRGYGRVATGSRKDSVVFVFGDAEGAKQPLPTVTVTSGGKR